MLLAEVDRWFGALDFGTSTAVAAATDLLEQHGPSLGCPIVDRIER